MMVNHVTPNMVLETFQHEGLVREAYKDSVGVWTWSFGITSMSGHHVERYRRNPQSVERCVEVAIWLLETKYWPAVQKAFKGKELTEAQAAAALSFHWNTGAIGRASWVKHFLNGDRARAFKAFMSWSKPKEIIPRRKAERDLFFGDRSLNPSETVTEWTTVSASGNINWSKSKRVNIGPAVRQILDGIPAEPKPAPLPEPVKDVVKDGDKPAWKSTTIISQIIAALSGVLSVVSQNPVLTYLLVGVVVAAGLYVICERHRKAKLAKTAQIALREVNGIA